MEDNCKPSSIKRDPCLLCALKHLGQARAILKETHKGYPSFPVFVWGHLAEAEDELIPEHPEEANVIRDHRVAYQDSIYLEGSEYELPIDDMIERLWQYNGNLLETQLRKLGYDEQTIADIQKG